MARMLAIDWDHNQLHVIAATTSGSGVTVTSVHHWQLEQPTAPAAGEAAGKRFRGLLKEAGVAPAPVVFCLGRDRVIIKEIHFPHVAPENEPDLIRFQAVKDIDESPERVVIDYAKIGKESAKGDNQALGVIVRRSVVETFQAFCRGAGLRLESLAPRPFGVAKAVQHVANPRPMAADTSAVLTIGHKWADFCVVQGGELLFTRSLAVGPTMANEIRRNFALYRNHAEIDESRDVPTALYIGAGAEHAELADQLEHDLNLRVHRLQPVDGAAGATANQGALTGAVGLLNAAVRKDPPAIDFMHPKEPKPPKKTSWVTIAAVAVAAVILFVGLIVVRNNMVGEHERRAKNFTVRNKDYQDKLKKKEQTELDIAALAEWDESSIPWLAEFAALAKRFPRIKGLRLTNVAARPSRTTKDEHKANIVLTGVVPEGEELQITQLIADINGDPHCRAQLKRFTTNNETSKKFVVEIDMTRRPEEVALSADPKEKTR